MHTHLHLYIPTLVHMLHVNPTYMHTCIYQSYIYKLIYWRSFFVWLQLEMLSFYYAELCLVSYEMVKFCPSLLAASAVYTAQNMLKSEERQYNWSKLLKHHSGYTESQLM